MTETLDAIGWLVGNEWGWDTEEEVDEAPEPKVQQVTWPEGLPEPDRCRRIILGILRKLPQASALVAVHGWTDDDLAAEMMLTLWRRQGMRSRYDPARSNPGTYLRLLVTSRLSHLAERIPQPTVSGGEHDLALVLDHSEPGDPWEPPPEGWAHPDREYARERERRKPSNRRAEVHHPDPVDDSPNLSDVMDLQGHQRTHKPKVIRRRRASDPEE